MKCIKRKKTACLLATVLIFATACSDSDKDSPLPPPSDIKPSERQIKKESFSYWFISNGCSTKKQVFESKEDLCQGLQNKSLNQNCAKDLREQKFKLMGCTGDFKEFIDETINSNLPSPVRCVGEISGTSGSREIDQVIHWDRTTAHRVTLSKFEDLKDSGQYFIDLIPPQKEGQTASLRIFGWFIDNNKNHSVEGNLDSSVLLVHEDRSLNQRKVNIKCGLEEPDIEPPAYQDLEIVCIGTHRSTEGKKDLFSASIKWDQVSQKSETLDLVSLKTGAKVASPFKIILTQDQATRLSKIKIIGTDLDSHVFMENEAIGRPSLAISYMSAWDNKEVNLSCLPTQDWQSISEVMNDEN